MRELSVLEQELVAGGTFTDDLLDRFGDYFHDSDPSYGGSNYGGDIYNDTEYYGGGGGGGGGDASGDASGSADASNSPEIVVHGTGNPWYQYDFSTIEGIYVQPAGGPDPYNMSERSQEIAALAQMAAYNLLALNVDTERNEQRYDYKMMYGCRIVAEVRDGSGNMATIGIDEETGRIYADIDGDGFVDAELFYNGSTLRADTNGDGVGDRTVATQ